VFAAFAGFEGTALFREDAKDPLNTVRRATFLAVSLIAVFQTFTTWAIVQAFGALAVDVANTEPTEMFAIAAGDYVGNWLVAVISIMVVFSWFASVLAFHNATACYLHALGRDGALPKILSRRSARTNSPWIASITHTTVTVVLVGYCIIGGLDPYLDLFVLGSVPVAVSLPAMECLTAIAIVAFFWRDRRGLSIWSTLIAPPSQLSRSPSWCSSS
jgi:amino acid transporter